MKILGAVILALLAMGPVSAQWGNVVAPGSGRVAGPANPWGNVVHPAIPGNGLSSSPYRRGRSSSIYGFPVYVGGYYGYGYGNSYDQSQAQPYQQQPNTVVVYPPAQPPVVINQYLGTPPDQGQAPDSNMRVYQSPSNTADTSASEGSYYLIAYKDHTIYSAVAYYVEGDTLHYFTSGNVHNQVSLSLVDRQLTAQLNRERNVNVQLGK